MKKAPVAGYSGKPTLDKLGIKPGMGVAVLGLDDQKAFLAELVARTSDVTLGRAGRNLDAILLRVDSQGELAKLATLAKQIRRNGMIWVVWPKGQAHIKEDMVRAVALAKGLVDVKVCAFSDVLSGLKLVIPVAKR